MRKKKDSTRERCFFATETVNSWSSCYSSSLCDYTLLHKRQTVCGNNNFLVSYVKVFSSDVVLLLFVGRLLCTTGNLLLFY